MISDDGRCISVGPGADAELIHACRLAEKGHKVVYYYCGDRQAVTKRISEICDAYPISLSLEKA